MDNMQNDGLIVEKGTGKKQIINKEIINKEITEEQSMVDMKKLQQRIYQNKINKGFNTTDVYREFCYTYGELTEACDAYMKQKPDLGEELADVAIYLLGLAEILGIDLEKEILQKMDINEKRQFISENGVLRKVE